jgi:hypothetical protein
VAVSRTCGAPETEKSWPKRRVKTTSQHKSAECSIVYARMSTLLVSVITYTSSSAAAAWSGSVHPALVYGLNSMCLLRRNLSNILDKTNA